VAQLDVDKAYCQPAGDGHLGPSPRWGSYKERRVLAAGLTLFLGLIVWIGGKMIYDRNVRGMDSDDLLKPCWIWESLILSYFTQFLPYAAIFFYCASKLGVWLHAK
jgi:hypothetical protein